MPHKGYRPTPEHRAAIGAGLRAIGHVPPSPAGRVWKAESLAKLRASRLGKKASPETLERQRLASLGNHRLVDAPVKGECAYCGRPANTFDHIVPRRHPQNTKCLPDCDRVPCCRICNQSKRDLTPDEWLAAGLYRTGGSS